MNQDTQALFGELRSLLQQPHAQSWQQLVAIIDSIDDAVFADELLPYLRDHLSKWPPLQRPIPDHWWHALTQTGDSLRAQLGGWRLIWRARDYELEDQEDDLEDQDEDTSEPLDDGFNLYTAVTTAAIHPQLKQALISDAAEWHHNGGDVALLNTADGSLLDLLLSGSDYHGEPYDSTFSPDGSLVAFAPVEETLRGQIHVWSTDGAQHHAWPIGSDAPLDDDELEDNNFETVLLAFSHDSQKLAAASCRTQKINIYNPLNGEMLWCIEGEYLVNLHAFALHPSKDQIAVIHDGPNGPYLYVYGRQADHQLRPAPGSLDYARLIAMAVFGLPSAQPLMSAPLPPGNFSKMTYSLDGTRLAAAGDSLVVWRVERGELIQEHAFKLCKAPHDNVVLTSNCSLVARESGHFRVAVIDEEVEGALVFDTQAPDQPITLSEPGQAPEAIALNATGTHLLCAHVARAWIWTLP
jgi:hypothetical protein